MSITLYCPLGIQFYERRSNGHLLGNDKVRPGRAWARVYQGLGFAHSRFFFYQVKIGGELYALIFHPGRGWIVAIHKDPTARKEKRALNIKRYLPRHMGTHGIVEICRGLM